MTSKSNQELSRRFVDQDTNERYDLFIRPQNQVTQKNIHKNQKIVMSDELIYYNTLNDKQSENGAGLIHLYNGLQGLARKNFITKVYIIVGLQLLFTTAMCFVSYYSVDFMQFQINNMSLFWVSLGLMILTQIVILCTETGRKHPYNLIALFLFTLPEAYLVSFITALTAEANGGAVVLMAACMTLLLVASLTIYAIYTKQDFTTFYGIIVVLTATLLMFLMFSLIAWTPFLHTLYCSLGILLFGIYLVIDTQLIIGGRKIALSIDDYVIGALLIYIDIIQIFLYILSLLGGRNK